MSAALDRLSSGYYNSDQMTPTNPGGLGGFGHQTNFPKMCADFAEVCGVDVIALVASAVAAAADAEAASASALNAPGTRKTSASTVLLATGTRVFGDVAGALFGKNQTLVATDQGNSANYMIGRVVSYADPVLTVEMSEANGPGVGTTKAAWDLVLTATGGVPISRKVLGGGMLTQSGTGALSADVTLTLLAATVAQIRAATNTGAVITPKGQADAVAMEPLTYAATVLWDTDVKGPNASVVLTGDPTIDFPTGLFDGCPVTLALKQDATGGRRPYWHAKWDFKELGARPTPNPGPNKVSFVYGTYWAITDTIDATFRPAV